MGMEVYFLRHGEADWPNWNKSDDERPLTKRGKKEMHEVGKFLKRIGAESDLIVTSPLPRASQTADIAAEHLDLKCKTDKLLEPGFGRQELERIKRDRSALEQAQQHLHELEIGDRSLVQGGANR